MRMLIQITGLEFSDTILLDDEKNLCVVSGKLLNINSAQVMQDLLNHMTTWEEVMVEEGIIDGETYKITIEKNGRFREYIIKNATPRNFDRFISIIRRLKECLT